MKVPVYNLCGSLKLLPDSRLVDCLLILKERSPASLPVANNLFQVMFQKDLQTLIVEN